MPFINRFTRFFYDHGHIFILTLCISLTFTDTISKKRQFNQTNEMLFYQESTRTFQDEKMKSNHASHLRENSNFMNTILSSRKGLNLKRAVTAQKTHIWDYGVIPYVIESAFTRKEKNIRINAMATWEKYTCIDFKEREPIDKHYIVFKKLNGCGSYVGNIRRGAQIVSLGEGCVKINVILHELGHAIGFYHEHDRPDRNKYVNVNLENVEKGGEEEFQAFNSSVINSLGEPYDYNSIMHYDKFMFSKNGKETITVQKQPGMNSLPRISYPSTLSSGDIRQTNKLYKCPGFGSTLTKRKGTFNFSPNRGKRDVSQWRIKAGHGERIQLNITSLSLTYSIKCINSYLEIRDGHYVKSPSLGRYCGKSLPGVLVSSGTGMWIEFNSLTVMETFSADYKLLCGGDIKNMRVLSPAQDTLVKDISPTAIVSGK